MGDRKVDLPKLALTQRRIIWSILAIYLACFAIPVLLVGVRFASPIYLMVTSLVMFVMLHLAAIVYAAIVYAAILSRRAGHATWQTAIVCAAMLIPIVNALVLSSVNRSATRLLRRAGVSVKLMGVPPAQMFKLYHGVCNRCGYDLTGLNTPACPECGCAIDVPNPQPLLYW